MEIQIKMEDLWNRLGAIIAAIVSAISGLYIYDRTQTNSRLTQLEKDNTQFKSDIRVIETQFSNLKEDTQEIKEVQRTILELLRK